ncbi:ParB/RepB/Spo0J family partition protein [Micromonospora sp. NPDC048063]|uniref:ParB/RepB/Spo0J family partition protein n=1 Tax=Micromonospora sp. NPDC048063 TaxID=3364256 RepID=UPI0037172CC1
MARRGSGLASNPLAQLQDDEKQEQAIVQAAQADGTAVRDLPINTVAPDPENPESRLTPNAELVASMKAEGQLQPGVVVPVEVWAGYGNDPTALPDGTEYVINYGHRRWAAARAAGLDTYRAIVSDTLKDNTTKRVHRLIENVQREDLTPLEEAAEYQRLMAEDKLSQREISRRTGIPQPHISKRISLLNLPEEARDALSKGIIPVEAAVELAKVAKEPERIRRVIDAVTAMSATDDTERTNRARLAVDSARKEYNAFKAAKDKTDKRKKLAAEGIVIIDNPANYFADKPGGRWAYEIRDDDKITAARDAGTLAAYVVTGDHVEFYLTELPPTPEPEVPEQPEQAEAAEQPGDDEPHAAEPAATDDGEAAPAETTTTVKVERTTTVPAPRAEPQETPEQRERRQKREQEEREREAAANARAAACARIAAKAPSRETLTARLARRILLVEEDHSFEAQQLAVRWLKAASVVDDSTTVYTLFGYDTNVDAKLAARAAYVYDLALSEIRAQESTDYDAEDAHHIKRLIEEADYEPAEWEQQALLVAASDN